MTNKIKVLTILTAIGIVISGYLTLNAGDPSEVACTIGGCEKVLTSKYAFIAGISVASLGLFWYLATAVLIWSVFVTKKFAPILFYLWLAGGLAFSLYLLGLEIFVIKYYCVWCLGSLAVVVLMVVATLIPERRFNGIGR